ncbi:MAG: DUF4412 domain-containing protein [Acidithiobacillales bacterium]
MKTFVRGALALLFVAATANAEFEGEADLKITATGERANVTGTGKTYVSKVGWRSEMEISSPEMAKATGGQPMRMVSFGRLSDPDKVYMVNDRMRTYAVLDSKKMHEMAKSTKKQEPKYVIKKLGRETVAGLPCENYQITQEGKKDTFEACMSKEFMSGDWMRAIARGRRGESDFLQKLREAGLEGYPIRFTSTDPDVKRSWTMELTKVERRPIPSSMFEVPPGYKETSMMGMMAQTPEQAKQMEEAQKRMEEAMKKMTPEQRKQMEEMMKKMGQQRP